MRTWRVAWPSTASIEPVIGVTFDGTGYGTDGTVWGGEFLVGDYRAFRGRPTCVTSACPAASRPSANPGGWRWPTSPTPNADFPSWEARCLQRELATVQSDAGTRDSTRPSTSSAGRLFDAVASLAGVRDSVSYEGQAAIELEWLATGVTPDDGPYPFAIEEAANDTAGHSRSSTPGR